MPDNIMQIGYKDIRREHENWNVSLFEDYLDIFYTSCIFSFHQTPIDVGGRPDSSIPKYVIFKLAFIYHNGTGLEPKCSWRKKSKTMPGRYAGDFYEFILDLETVNSLG
jgi:hypothetical protein